MRVDKKMKNNNRPISDGLKGFPKHTVCVSGYPKKMKAEKTNKKYNKNKLIVLILLVGFLHAYIIVSFVK